MHHTDPAAAAAAAAVPAGTHVDGGASDHPPPYAATVSSRPPIKTEPALDDMSGGSGQFVPLTPPLNRSRPTSGANANVTGAAATTAAGNRRTTKTAGARASSTTAVSLCLSNICLIHWFETIIPKGNLKLYVERSHAFV